MKFMKHKKFFVLFVALFIFYTIIGGTFSIYREKQSDSINLSILNSTGMVTVNFNANGGTISFADSSRSVQSGTAVGQLPEATRTNQNFIGWFTDPNDGDEITEDTIVTGTTVTYYAHWAKIVCKKAVTGTLHSETCVSTGSCAASGGGYNADDTIYYGTIPGATSPIVGDAYDCDVNDDGTWDPQTERFYYIRSYGTTDPYKNSVLVHYTGFDEDGQMDSSTTRGSYVYEDVGNYLPGPTKWGWDNTELIEMDGNVTRLISREDITAACGTATGGTKFANCRFFLENSRYQSKSLGRAGIWVLAEGTSRYRIHTETLTVANPPSADSQNTVRPVIEIPSNTIEGFKPKAKFTITLDSQGGEPSGYSFYKYDGQEVGTLPTPTKEGFTFSGWYTDNQNYTTEITAGTVVTANIHGYAKWVAVTDDYAFYIPGECTFTSTGITNGENGNCISTVNPTGSNIDYTQSSLASKKYIDTGVALYDSTNHDKNYEIHFEIVSYDGSENESQATFFNTKQEATGYPGLVVRRSTTKSKEIEFASRKTSSANENVILNSDDITKMSVYRINGEIYYSINDGEKVFVNNLTQYNPVFNLTTWFGGAPTNASATAARRFLIGTLKNIYIKLTDPSETVTVTFNPGEGTVTPTSKTFASGTAIGELPTPERTGYTFDGWYTDPTNGTKVTASTTFSSSDTIYAHWLESITVTFNADGGEVSPTSKTFGSGTAIGELPTPTKIGYYFDGWYTDNTWATEVTDETVFNSSTTIIAKWEESDDITVTFNADGGTVSPTSKTFVPGSAIGELPIPEKTGYVFVGWYTDNTWGTEVTSETTFDTTTSIIARWEEETYVACIGSTCYTTLAAAVTAVPSTGVKTTIKIIQDITTTATTTISSNRWVELDIGTHTIAPAAGTTYALFTNNGKLNIINGTLTSTAGYIIDNRANSTLNISGGKLTYNSANDSEHKVIEIKGGTVNITGGTLTCNSKAAAINVNAGTLNVSGGEIKGSNTFKGQAIYNNGGTTTISGTAYLENVSANNTNGRAAVHNYSGTINILGGTIVSKANSAVKNNGTMTIGVSGDSIDTTSPVLQGSIYGLETVEGYTVTIYGGIFKGKGTTADKAISNESYVDTGTATIVHDTETIDNVQYDVAYLQNSSSNITVNFNVNGGDTVEYNSKTLTESGPVGSLPSATKDGSSFLGWFTSATGGERVLTTTEVEDDGTTYYAHYTNATTVCRPATTLHTSGQTEFGQIPTGTVLTAGDAYDCDVNGDGTFDSVNERFYYLTDTSNGKAAFIYSNNISQVNDSATPICSATAVNYAPTFTEGPNTAIGELPTTTQWSNVNIYTEPRTITNQSGTTVLSDYIYTEKAARFATLDEIKAATSSSLNETANELASYTFLLENTVSYGSGCRSNYWLETTNSNGGAVRINGAANAQSLGHATGSSGVRPVIEVPYESIDGVANIIEFDTIPAAMRTYFNNVDSWNTGQDDTNYSSFNASMTANLNNYNCAYYTNDNVSAQYGSVFCDQPNKYDTGVTGDINVYEYDESTGVRSNTIANYVFNDNGKLYNFIPGKVYYWESDSDSTKNGYVRPTGERRLITIPGITRQTRNVRDLGGLPVDTDGNGTIDGKLKYQKLYRGEKIWGANRDGTVRAQLEKLGIYNEYDLRTPGSEIVASEEDQLSNYTLNEIVHYKIDYTEFGSPATETRFNGKSYYQLARDAAIDVMQKVVAGNDDYSLYFHCRIGADRTGTLAYLLEGVLGVPTEYRHQDYELTTFFGLRERTRYYYKKDSTNDEYKFIYLKKAIRHATPGNNENTGEENVMDWFLLEGNSTDECDNITTLINQFRAKMIDYN